MSHDALFQRAIEHLDNMASLIQNSSCLNSDALLPHQRQYLEPFGIDKMLVEQWFLYVYYPVAKNHLVNKNLALFKNELNFATVVYSAYKNQLEKDHKELIGHAINFDQAIGELHKAHGSSYQQAPSAKDSSSSK